MTEDINELVTTKISWNHINGILVEEVHRHQRRWKSGRELHRIEIVEGSIFEINKNRTVVAEVE